MKSINYKTVEYSLAKIAQMAEFFQKDRSVISKHIKNVFDGNKIIEFKHTEFNTKQTNIRTKKDLLQMHVSLCSRSF